MNAPVKTLPMTLTIAILFTGICHCNVNRYDLRLIIFTQSNSKITSSHNYVITQDAVTLNETGDDNEAGRGSAHARYLFVALLILVLAWSSGTVTPKDRTLRQIYNHSFDIISTAALYKPILL